jgi:hypothetical protein
MGSGGWGWVDWCGATRVGRAGLAGVGEGRNVASSRVSRAQGGADLRPAPPCKLCAPHPAPPNAPSQMGELGHPAAGPQDCRLCSSPGPGQPLPCAQCCDMSTDEYH